uniref:Integrase_H2C2 domain-containing protein n=1 Tax=Meloidogyne hapla TaxID=6305 RepID=A0A1I8B953_MELHA
MPSSGAIRSQLGPALRALKDHLTAATALVRAEAGRDLTQLRAEQHHLSRTLERVDNLNDKWANLMDRLEGDDLAVEVYILRFSKLVLRKEGAPKFGINLISENGPLTAADITLAEIYLIRWEQKECLEELKKYKHIVDDQSIIRLQTRMTNSQSPEGLIHPILLPKNSDVGKLLIAHIHKRLCHGGVDWTLTEYLTRYWQPRARQTVRRVISECMACRKMNSYKYALPQMPPLPNDRVQQRRPFQSIGVDYAGPTLTKLNGALIKCWLVLITV